MTTPFQSTAPIVVLFDVDETLVLAGGSGARSWSAAFERLHGVRPILASTPQPVRRTHKWLGRLYVSRCEHDEVAGRSPQCDYISLAFPQ